MNHRSYFLQKSAGISPQTFVSHFTIFVENVLLFNHCSARSISSKSCWFSKVLSSFVLHFFFKTQLMAVLESVYKSRWLFIFFKCANPWTRAKNSPILFVPFWYGPLWNSIFFVWVYTPLYSMSPGFPLEAASTAIESKSVSYTHLTLPTKA